MIIYPAIDLKDGNCVRLYKGEMEQATVFNPDPANQAKLFEKQGFSWIHLVDLNGAFAGKPVNSTAVEGIIKAVNVPLQLGGGIRDLATIEHWLTAGIRRIVLGTAALRNPDLVKEACRLFPERIAVGIDARGGKVAVQGWAETSQVTVTELALKFEDAGVAAIIYTDVDRDGTLTGPDLTGTAALVNAIRTPVIASGGMSTLDDVKAVKAISVAGVIVGRAFYDGRIVPAEALAAAKQSL